MGASRKQPIDIPVNFPSAVDRPGRAKVVVDLLKSLLHQRGQIPLQFEALAKDVEAEQGSREGEEYRGAVTREEAKERRDLARKQKTRKRYLVAAEKFLKGTQEGIETLEQELLTRPLITAVSFLFGATLLSPREAYTVQLPPLPTLPCPPCPLGVHIFRAMVTNDCFFQLVSTRIPVSNIFVVIHTKDSGSPSQGLTVLDSFQLPPSCTKISFSLNTKEQGVEKEQEQRVDEGQEVEWKEPVLRRLRFVSGDDPHSGVRQASCSPEVFSPDLQNGFHSEVQDRRGQNGFHKMEDIQEVQDTRCQNGFHGLEDIQEVQDMHLCTPAVKTQGRPIRESGSEVSRMVPCTPAAAPMREDMELCTPAVRGREGRLQGSNAHMELCTPATRRTGRGVQGSGAHMELCTPAVNRTVGEGQGGVAHTGSGTPSVKMMVREGHMELCTPAVSRSAGEVHNVRTGMCTPAVKIVGRARREQGSGSHMELCTPAVSRTSAGEVQDRVEHRGMCTPAVKRTVGTVPPCTPAAACMEMCTPAVSRGKGTPLQNGVEPSTLLGGSETRGQVQGMPSCSPLVTPILNMGGKENNNQNWVKEEEENQENHVEELGKTTFLMLQMPIRGFKC